MHRTFLGSFSGIAGALECAVPFEVVTCCMLNILSSFAVVDIVDISASSACLCFCMSVLQDAINIRVLPDAQDMAKLGLLPHFDGSQ